MFVKPSLILSAAVAAVCAVPSLALAAPINQGIFKVDGSPQTGASTLQGMSRSGRHIIFTSGNEMFLRDIKTQVSTALNTLTSDSTFALSPSGRYIGFYQITQFSPLIQKTIVVDRVTNVEKTIAAKRETNIGLSDNGFALFIKEVSGQKQLIRLNLNTNAETIIATGDINLGSSRQRNPLSADGRVALFSDAGTYKIYNAATQQTTVLNPLHFGSVPVHVDGIDLASSGKFVVIYEHLYQQIHRLDLSLPQQLVESFELGNKSIEKTDAYDLSVSSNGRFVSFKGYIMPGHPEWAAANALDPINYQYGYPRIFRYDTLTDSLVTVSTAYDGSTLFAAPGQPNPLWPIVNSSTILSDDGSMVEFSTSSHNIVSTPVSLAMSEANYHVFLSSGFSRNYQFVDMPNSEIAYKAFAPMTLVGNNLWQGTIAFDGVNDSFKFDVGGPLVNGKFAATAAWGINFGAGSQNIAASNGGNIAVTGGAGNYKVTFNDQTLVYTFKRMVDVTFNCYNAVTTATQTVFAVGSVQELGSWVPTAAIKLVPGSNFTWSGTVSVPANTTIEWKCIKREVYFPANPVVWEPGANNQFNANSNQATDGNF